MTLAIGVVLVVIAARWTYWSIRKRMALAEGRRSDALALACRALRPLEDRPQALELLAFLEPDGEWGGRLGREYPTFYQVLCSH